MEAIDHQITLGQDHVFDGKKMDDNGLEMSPEAIAKDMARQKLRKIRKGKYPLTCVCQPLTHLFLRRNSAIPVSKVVSTKIYLVP